MLMPDKVKRKEREMQKNEIKYGKEFLKGSEKVKERSDLRRKEKVM